MDNPHCFNKDITNIDKFMSEIERYKHLKSSDINEIPDDKLITAVTSWVEGKFAEDFSDMCSVLNKINTPAQNVYCCDYMLREFLSGGFSQVFYNTSTDFVKISSLCFKAIGEKLCAEKILYIIEKYKDSKDANRCQEFSDIEMFIDSNINSPLSYLDDEFKKVFDYDIYKSKIINYIRNKKQYFGD